MVKCLGFQIIMILLALLIGFSTVRAQSQIGEKAPGFTTSTLDGKKVALKDYWEQQGRKALVLSFFATWCGPCKHDLKYLQKIQDQYGAKGLHVISVLTQDQAKEDAIKRFLQELGVRLPVLMDQFSIIGRRYGVTALPCNFLIDREGILKAKYLGYSDAVKREFESRLKELL